MTQSCTATQNRTCGSCTAGTNFSTTTNAGSCTTCADCNAGQYVTQSCTATQNRTCGSCNAGTNFSTTTNAGSCTACTTCTSTVSTLSTLTGCTTTSGPGYCSTTCQNGYTSNGGVCTCAAGKYIRSSDNQCVACQTCSTSIAYATSTLSGCTGSSPGTCTVSCNYGFTPNPSSGAITSCTCAGTISGVGAAATCGATPCVNGQTYSSSGNAPCSQCTTCTSTVSTISTLTGCTTTSGPGYCSTTCRNGYTSNGGVCTCAFGKYINTSNGSTCDQCTTCSAAPQYGTVSSSGCTGTTNRTCTYGCNTATADNGYEGYEGFTAVIVNGVTTCVCQSGYIMGLMCLESQACVPGQTYSSSGNAPCSQCTTCTSTVSTISTLNNCTATFGPGYCSISGCRNGYQLGLEPFASTLSCVCPLDNYIRSSDNQCVACTTCTAPSYGTVTSTGCSGTTDRTCTYQCNYGFTLSGTGASTTCTCAAGNYIRSSDNTCQPCTAGTNYSTTTNANSCSACTNCTNVVSTLSTLNNCTATSGPGYCSTTCQNGYTFNGIACTCASGNYINNSNGSTCDQCTTCTNTTSTTYIANGGCSGYTDRICTMSGCQNGFTLNAGICVCPSNGYIAANGNCIVPTIGCIGQGTLRSSDKHYCDMSSTHDYVFFGCQFRCTDSNYKPDGWNDNGTLYGCTDHKTCRANSVVTCPGAAPGDWQSLTCYQNQNCVAPQVTKVTNGTFSCGLCPTGYGVKSNGLIDKQCVKCCNDVTIAGVTRTPSFILQAGGVWRCVAFDAAWNIYYSTPIC